MFKKILLPLDLTDRHQPALDLASELARQSSGDVILLHVIEIIPGLDMEDDHEFYARLENTAREHLNQHGNTLGTRNISWHAKVLYGHRAVEITRHAAETATDLIILVAPRLAPDKADGWGSLSYKVGLFAPCPVLLVK